MAETQIQKRVNYTKKERSDLLNILQKYPTLTGKATDNKSLAFKRRLWENVTEDFNKVEGHITQRTSEQLKKLWENLKNDYKKKLVSQKHTISRTGGGPFTKPTIEEDPNLEIILDSVDIELKYAKDSDTVAAKKSSSSYSLTDNEVPTCSPLLNSSSLNIVELTSAEMFVAEENEISRLEEEISTEETVALDASKAYQPEKKKSKIGQSVRSKTREAIIQDIFKHRKAVIDTEHKWKEEVHNIRKNVLKAKMKAYAAKVEANEAKKAYYESLTYNTCLMNLIFLVYLSNIFDTHYMYSTFRGIVTNFQVHIKEHTSV